LFPIINGLSDHNAQTIIIPNILEQNCNTHVRFNRRIDKFSIIDFNTKLSYESWEGIFAETDVNTIPGIKVVYMTNKMLQIHNILLL
jgi:hypothetical protein